MPYHDVQAPNVPYCNAQSPNAPYRDVQTPSVRYNDDHGSECAYHDVQAPDYESMGTVEDVWPCTGAAYLITGSAYHTACKVCRMGSAGCMRLGARAERKG